MQFKHIKMTGFKSFAEPEEIHIDEGMTGIVGPNGCGKSNIVEGLRWVMGESSARNMRGTEIDDLVFSGTTSRPSRNFAEVVLTLDNSAQKAPAQYNGSDEVQIARKLDRGKTSTFRINGKVVRAKDVQLLFADLATGSRSGGIVSQGRVDALINAKPRDRRNLLEEAASISGLHRRRHEAELRLNTAETNLGRLEDILVQLEEQKSSLVKQARQASRYRSIADRIRKADALLMLTRFTASMAELEEAERQVREAEREVAAATEEATARQRKRDEAAGEMQPLREAEAVAAAELQRLKMASSELDSEEERARQAAEDARARKAQITQDTAREKQLLEDAEAAIATMAEEVKSMDTEDADEAPRLKAAAEQLETARRESDDAGKALADAAARAGSAEREVEGVQRRLEDLKERKARADESVGELDLAALETAAKDAAEALKQAETGAGEAGKARAEAEAGIERARADLDAATGRRNETGESLSRARAEVEGLSSLVGSGEEDGASPVSGAVKVADGYEDALAAVLGEGLSAPVGRHGNAYWSESATTSPPGRPEGTTPLTDHVKAPSALAAALAGIGLVDDDKSAESLQTKLKPGQAITTRDGGLWRWDGFVLPHGSENAAAKRLRQEARLRELDGAMPPLVAAAGEAEAAVAEASGRLESLQSGLQTLREAETGAVNAHNDALREEQRSRDAFEAAGERHAEIGATLGEIESALKEAEAEAAALGDTRALHEEVERLTLAAEEKRQALAEAMGAERGIADAKAMRARRREEIGRESENWRQRQEGARQRIGELGGRMQQAEQDEEKLKGVPEEIDRKRAALAETLEGAEKARRDAGDRLAEAETGLKQVEGAVREAEAALGNAREKAIRQESQRDLHKQQQDSIVSRIRERLDTRPEDLPELAGVSLDEELDTDNETIEKLEQRHERLIRERDNMGPVNLRAEAEMEELEARAEGLASERDDLIGAISKLRTAISELNREGRQRLLNSFKDVNRYFSVLFETLFNGGTAELKLAEDEDPLEAGLEIYASPPGKKLQSLDLLSGGEKALTAIALIFAVFLTNPSPICVLDEVDAPLDDNNVARFCDMLEQIAEKTGSRFIVVTHHRLTMARMDRLFGVTMEEKGVSRIVSVDLQAAERFQKSA